MAAVWHYAKGDQQFGPVTSEQLKQLAAAGQLAPDDMLWKDGMPDWVPASRVKGLFAHAAVAQPAGVAAASAQAYAAPATGYAQPEAYADPAQAQQQIGYYNPTGLSGRTARILAGMPRPTGSQDDWPLSDQHLAQVAAAGRWRKDIRRCATLYNVLMIIYAVGSAVGIVQLIVALGAPRFIRTELTIVSLVSLLLYGGLTVLAFFTAKATLKCQLWGIITMIVLLGLGALGMAIVGVIIMANEGPVGFIFLIAMAIPGACIWVSIQAMTAIPKFLATPVWAQEALIHAQA